MFIKLLLKILIYIGNYEQIQFFQLALLYSLWQEETITKIEIEVSTTVVKIRNDKEIFVSLSDENPNYWKIDDDMEQA